MFNLFRRRTRRETGEEGETLARTFLEKKGYVFLAANHRTRFGEVDLVMEDGGTVVFVEVRARRSNTFGHPLETITRKKQGRVAHAALDFIKANGLARHALRFDVVAIEGDAVTHIPHAFIPSTVYSL
jgi:putative endonuclease